MILAQGILHIQNSDFAKTFLINIQFGAILAVLVMYFKRFFQTLEFYKSLFIAFIPAAVLGFLLNDFIDSLLESVPVVAVSLVLGGFVLIWVDKIFKQQNTEEKTANNAEISSYPNIKQSFVIGLAQCVAMIPGVSRSGSTLTAALALGLKRDEAARFSFLLGLPAIALAGFKELWELHKVQLSADGWSLLLVGLVVASISAFCAIWGLMRVLERFSAWPFVIYRGVLGIVLIWAVALGYFT